MTDPRIPDPDYDHLSVEQTKSMITAHAFKVAPSLFGTPLATPWQRGLAMLCDGIVVGILSQQSGAILAIVAAAAFFKAGSKDPLDQKWHTTRKVLRWLGLLLVLLVGANLIKEFAQSSLDTTKDGSPSIASLLGSSLKYAGFLASFEQHKTDPQCLASQCWLATAQAATLTMAKDGLDKKAYQQIIGGFIDDEVLALTDEQKKSIMARLDQVYQENLSAPPADPVDKPASEMTVQDETKSVKTLIAEKKEPASNITQWIKGIIEDDLGMGFGWAALYFTLFTAWWHGQTPGKRLLGIRVIALDGRHLGLWDAFGRYGGYGAGFATGLLGFAQIYWDPNRQAIQDKISATVVIKADVSNQ